jgi:hypothetical protein
MHGSVDGESMARVTIIISVQMKRRKNGMDRGIMAGEEGWKERER